jgi:hypothetical protein
MYDRYRVYDPDGERRARSFSHLRNAQDFAEEIFHDQGITPKRPVSIVAGSGTDFRTVATYGPRGSTYGWTWTEREGDA